jgi:hypothetical protein
MAIETYRGPDGEDWRVSRFDLLTAEFPSLTAGELPLFHEVVARDPRAWLIARRLFGLQPMMPGADVDPLEFRPRTRAELKSELGLTDAQLKQELDSLRGRWTAKAPAVEAPVGAGAAGLPAAEPREEFEFKDALTELKRMGFLESLFERKVVDYSDTQRREDIEWFYGRATNSGMAKLLDHPMAGAKIRQILITELHLRWVNSDLGGLAPGSRDYNDQIKTIDVLSERHAKMLREVNEFAPWMDLERKQMSFANAISEVARGIQEYRAKGTNTLIDGMFTASEIQFQFRQNNHTDIRYRLGLVVWVNMARERLFDPEFQQLFPPNIYKALDEGFREGAHRAAPELPVIKLESEDPADEYPAIRGVQPRVPGRKETEQ